MVKDIFVVSSTGGHYVEAQILTRFFSSRCMYIISNKNLFRANGFERGKDVKVVFHGVKGFKLFLNFFEFFYLYLVYRPRLVISTGASVAFPSFIVAKIFGIKTVFVESITRVRSPSKTARLVYRISDRFFVFSGELVTEFAKAEVLVSID